MQTDRELLQMALDYAKALHNGGSRVYDPYLVILIESLSAALAAKEPEPVAYKVTSKLGEYCGFKSSAVKKGDLVYLAPPQLKQEPVWCGCGDEIVADTGARCGTCVGIRDMRQWRGLSYEEFTAVRRSSQFRDVSESSCKKFYRAIEAKLREKNDS